MQAARQEEVAKAIAGLREYPEIAGAAQQRSLSSRPVCLTSLPGQETSLPEQENGWLQKPVATLRRSQRLAGFEPVICPEASAVRVLVRRGSPWGAIVGVPAEFVPHPVASSVARRGRGPARITLWFETAN